ncbi:MAG TPA: N-acetylmuramoyl-L-alanine amidase [Desulfotomaculum sp.]|nr:N-acetylmuramoyl-L-alanine amidase [Desulfotomaculum sp.]
MKIVIDQGHGGSDPGAVGNGLTEAVLTGQLGLIVVEKLSGYNAEVILAPRGTLSERAAFANSAGADLFVSIHVNAGGGTGYESHIHPGASEKTLSIARSMHSILAVYYREKGFADRGLKRSNFGVLRETRMPAVLLENLFIDSPVDAAFLRGGLPGIGNEIAWSIARAMGLDLSPQDLIKEEACGTGLTEILCDLQKIEADVSRLRRVINELLSKE